MSANSLIMNALDVINQITKKSVGLKTEPCGTLDMTSHGDE